jgi:hypothetical protein
MEVLVMVLERMVGIPATWDWVLDGREWIMILVREGMEGWIYLMGSFLEGRGISKVKCGGRVMMG